MRAALYCRVSDPQHQTSENQSRLLKEFAAREHYEIVEVYTDEMTGTTLRRPAFQRMMNDAKERRFDLVLFFALDRLSRGGPLETLQTLKTLKDWGVDWISYTEPYLRSIGPFAEAVIAILAVIAKQESIRRSERARAAIARVRAEGRGDTLGRKKKVFPRYRVLEMRKQGMSLGKIRSALLKEGFKVGKATLFRVVHQSD